MSPFSFQTAWRSSSEISVSNVAVSVSVTSTLYSGRVTLISRSAEAQTDIRGDQGEVESDWTLIREDSLTLEWMGIEDRKWT